MKESGFQFERPLLIGLTYDLNNEFELNSDKPIDLKLNFTVEVNCDEEADKEAEVALILEIGSKDKDSPYYIMAKEVSLFTWDNDSDEYSEVLLHQNAPALLLSYLRPMIVNITAASPYPAYNIPFLDFTDE